MARVTHFEISANDPEQTIAFYRGVFGWKVEKWQGPVDYWLIDTGAGDNRGINGAFFKPRETFTGTVLTVEVEDLDATLERVRAQGGTVVVERHAIPGVGFQAFCKDREGTLFGVHQPDLQAGSGGGA